MKSTPLRNPANADVELARLKSELAAARGARERAEAVVDAVWVPLLQLDGALNVRGANRSFAETFGAPSAAALGRSVFELSHGRWDVPGLRERLKALAAGGLPFTDWEGEFDIARRGRRTVSVSGRAVAGGDPDERRLLILLEDVSARNQSAEAAASRRNEAKQREFVANVSHELMTPITAIKGYSEALLTGALESPRRRLRFTQVIEKHAERLAQLVEDLLELSSYEAGHPKSKDAVPLREHVDKLLLGLAPLARRRGISIRVDAAPSLKVAVNKEELGQILQNLIENAIKYNRSRGRIHVGAALVGKRVVVSVRDTGIGVPKEDLTRIFDRFHRAANARAQTERGSGLGLSIVKSILAGHGCRIWAESAAGKGTTFFFTLPRA